MNLENAAVENSIQQKKEWLEVLDQTTDQKKEAFQHLVTDIENLKSEIERLDKERKILVAASAEQSVIDCLYG